MAKRGKERWGIWWLIWRNIRGRRKPLGRRLEPSAPLSRRPRSIFLRHLDCGSCNGCELELHALHNPLYDIEQYGIRFESSPRHADVLVLTGPYTRNLDQAAQRTAAAMSDCRIVTVGECTADGGVFRDSYALVPRPEPLEAAIEAHIPGCPPTPEEILQVLVGLGQSKA